MTREGQTLPHLTGGLLPHGPVFRRSRRLLRRRLKSVIGPGLNDAALREALERHRAVVDALTDPVFRCAPDGSLTFANQAARAGFGIKAGEPVEQHRLDEFFPDECEIMGIALSSLHHEYPTASIECPGARYRGRPVWNQWTITAVYGPDGVAREYQLSGRDVTAYKMAEDRLRNSLTEKEALLEEIHHRVKNNLQIISSILDLSSMEAVDPRTMSIIGDARARIHTMALIHSQLMRSDRVDQIEIRQHVTDLIEYLFHVHEKARNRITPRLDIGEVFLNMDRAVPFGLVLYEILSNSFKHAFPGDDEGEIRVRITSDRDRIQVTITDTGIGFSFSETGDHPERFGMRLVRLIVCEQLGGTLDLSGSRGAEYRISFPV